MKKSAEEFSVEYSILKSDIIKSCVPIENNPLGFNVNYKKLDGLVKDLGLTLIDIGTSSRKIKPDDLPLLSEHFKGKRLSWLDSEKEFTTILFVKSDDIEENLEIKLNTIDNIQVIAYLMANYPCYMATIVSYISRDPKRYNKRSYEIICRANTVVIKQELYKYNHNDI